MHNNREQWLYWEEERTKKKKKKKFFSTKDLMITDTLRNQWKYTPPLTPPQPQPSSSLKIPLKVRERTWSSGSAELRRWKTPFSTSSSTTNEVHTAHCTQHSSSLSPVRVFSTFSVEMVDTEHRTEQTDSVFQWSQMGEHRKQQQQQLS